MSKTNFSILTRWDGSFRGKGKIEGENFDVDIAAPISNGGSGDGASPKELYASSAAACFTATLRSITENKKLPVASIAVRTNVETEGDQFSIRHAVDLQLNENAADKDIEAARRMIESADKMCLMGNLARKAGGTIDVDPIVKLPQ